MTIITLDTAKAHLRVETNDEDVLIQLYLNAARQSAEDYISRPIYANQNEQLFAEDESGVLVNDAIRAAVLLQLGTLYRDREATSEKPTTELSLGAKHLLQPYKLWKV